MRKMITLFLIYMMLVTSCMIFVFTVETVKASVNTLYVGGSGPGNNTRIQDAIDNASDGNIIFVYSGNYFENIVINKQIIIIGQNKSNTIIDGNGRDDVLLIKSNFVKISGFTIQNSGDYFGTNDYDCGIDIRSNLNTVFDTIISNNLYGINIQGTYGNNISRNILTSNCFFSIQISCSNNNSIIFNNISNNDYGLYINETSNNIISNNLITNNNNWGIQLFDKCINNIIKENKIISNNNGVFLNNYCTHNIIKDNIIDSNKANGIYIFYQCSNNIIRFNNMRYNGYFGIYNYNSNNNNISNNIIENNKGGIKITDSSNNIILYNSLKNDYIVFQNSYLNVFVNNTINYNPILYLEYKNNLIIDDNYEQIILINCNNISLNNLNIPFGILLLKSTHCSIINNTIYANDSIGITLYSQSTNNLIINNFISNNKGIHLISAHNNIFLNNTIINCSRGFSLDKANYNAISNNYIHNNYYGIFIYSGKNCCIKDNIIINNKDSGIILDYYTYNMSIYNNYISNNENGIYTYIDFSSSISYNQIDSNKIGINSIFSRDITISFNHINSNEKAVNFDILISGIISDNNISNNQMGIQISDYKYRFSNENGQIIRNNFINNNNHATFETTWNSPIKRHNWNNNYWDNYQGFGKKSIPGIFYILYMKDIYDYVIFSFSIPWRFYDKFPAKEPYDIP